jgi:hypothetical protein
MLAMPVLSMPIAIGSSPGGGVSPERRKAPSNQWNFVACRSNSAAELGALTWKAITAPVSGLRSDDN